MGGGAYFHEKQPGIGKPSSRATFAPIPIGWAELGAIHGHCFDEHQRGGGLIHQIVSNVPGLQNAGVMWAEEFTAFLLGFGFTQSTVDRRLFYLHGKVGFLVMAGTFVDDYKPVVPSGAMAAAFNGAWQKTATPQSRTRPPATFSGSSTPGQRAERRGQ